MNELRPVASHPSFAPITAIIAVLVTMFVMGAVLRDDAVPTASTRATSASITAATGAPAASSVVGTVRAVHLARDTGERFDEITVRQGDGTTLRLIITEQSTVVVPEADRYVVGGPLDLIPGQRVGITLAPGATPGRGAGIARIKIDGGVRDGTATA